jgi:hypothetical protein
MARSDRRLVLAAQLIGVAGAFAQVHRLNEYEALAEINAELARFKVRPGSRTAVEALTRAAAHYVVLGEPEAHEYWYADAVWLLVMAGANESAARAMQAAPKTQGMPGQE